APASLVSACSLRCSLFSTAPPPPDVYTLSLHDALPIYLGGGRGRGGLCGRRLWRGRRRLRPGRCRRRRLEPADQLFGDDADRLRSEEHTSGLQSLTNLLCPLLL